MTGASDATPPSCTLPAAIFIYPGASSIFRPGWGEYQIACAGTHRPGSGHPWEVHERNLFEVLLRRDESGATPFDRFASRHFKRPTVVGSVSLEFGKSCLGWGGHYVISDIRASGAPPSGAELQGLGNVLTAFLGLVLMRDRMYFVVRPGTMLARPV